jgi:hypothetical protein
MKPYRGRLMTPLGPPSKPKTLQSGDATMPKSISLISLLALVAVSPAHAAPTQITACGTISQPGSYVLAKNLSVSSGNCLVIAANSGSVTIDLAGFTITGTGTGTGITRANGNLAYITVRNGNILGFHSGVDLGDFLGSVIEGMDVSSASDVPGGIGISANGIVKDNQVSVSGRTDGINAAGRVTGNQVSTSSTSTGAAMSIFSSGSTVIGNNVLGVLTVRCPSNVTDNLSVDFSPAAGTLVGRSPILEGQGCNNTNNVAP